MTPRPLETIVTASLRTLLTETLFRADPRGSYVINRGEPGLIETLKSLTAEMVSTPPAPGRKPIVSHANHVLFGLGLIDQAYQGHPEVFEGADWSEAWKLQQVDSQEWQALLQELEQRGQSVLQHAIHPHSWSEIMLTGTFACAAHAAYHLGAIRQMLYDIQGGSR